MCAVGGGGGDGGARPRGGPLPPGRRRRRRRSVWGGEAAGPAGRRGPLPAAGALRGGDRAPALRSLPPHRHAHTHTPGGRKGERGRPLRAGPGPTRLAEAAVAGCGSRLLRPRYEPVPLRGGKLGRGCSHLRGFSSAFFLSLPFLFPPPPFFFPVFFFLNFPFADCKWMPCGSVLGRRCPFAYELGSGAAAGRAASLNAANHASRMGFLLLFFLLPLICPKGGISRVSLFWGYTTSG